MTAAAAVPVNIHVAKHTNERERNDSWTVDQNQVLSCRDGEKAVSVVRLLPDSAGGPELS